MCIPTLYTSLSLLYTRRNACSRRAIFQSGRPLCVLLARRHDSRRIKYLFPLTHGACPSERYPDGVPTRKTQVLRMSNARERSRERKTAPRFAFVVYITSSLYKHSLAPSGFLSGAEQKYEAKSLKNKNRINLSHDKHPFYLRNRRIKP